jgi:formylglycine-generating enzyme required for sulfatase activity
VDLLGRYAGYNASSQDHAWFCGSLLPNDLGLFDMLGNMWEWCHDEFHQVNVTESKFNDINISISVNESNPRILRGGAFDTQAAYVRSALRFMLAPAYRLTNFGFRPSRTYY